DYEGEIRAYENRIRQYEGQLRHYKNQLQLNGGKSRDPECLFRLTRIIIEILRVQAKTPSASEILITCRRAVDSLSDILRETTGKKCAVCIKLITYSPYEQPNNNQPKAIILCRDHTSSERERTRDRDHWISKNTAFDTVCNSPQRTFYSNNLPSLRKSGCY